MAATYIQGTFIEIPLYTRSCKHYLRLQACTPTLLYLMPYNHYPSSMLREGYALLKYFSFTLCLSVGRLAAPSNVQAATTDTGVTTIMWEPPFTLNITDVDPDITGYGIYKWTSDVAIANTTATNFTFSDAIPCINGSNYLVSAFNPVGEGNRSEEITG